MRKKGISLIVLIVTIIVVIILAAAVILTLSKNNPIESAKEARFKEDVRTFQDELALTVSKQYTTAGGHRDEKITTSDFDEIKEYIPSFSEKYKDKFVIQDDELKYTSNLDEKEKEYAQILNVNKRKSILPDEYQQVEYIESTGTQYIDTKYNITEKFKYKIKYAITDTRVNTDIWPMVIGAYGRANASDGKHYVIGYTPSQKKSHGIDYDINEIIDIEFKLGESIVNGSKIDNTRIWNGNPYGTVCLFNVITSDKGIPYSFYSIAKVYSAQIYDQDNLTRNLIPCYSTTTVIDANGKQCSSGTKGLYDLVEEKFYTNQGTGEFIPGPDVD